MEELESLLLTSICGDNERMASAIELFEQMKSQDVNNLFQLFCQIILASANAQVVGIAIVNLTQLIYTDWDNLGDVQKATIPDFVKSVRTKAADDMIHIVAELIVAISRNMRSDFGPMMDIYQTMNDGTVKGMRLTLELSLQYQIFEPSEVLAIWMSGTVPLILSVLRGDTFYYKSLAVRTMGVVLDLLPDQIENLNEHFIVVKELMTQSLTVSSEDFGYFWSACADLFRSIRDAMEFEEFCERGFKDSAFACSARADLGPDLRILPLHIFGEYLGYMDPSDLHGIAAETCELADIYVRQEGQLPDEFILFYDSCFKCFDHEMLYKTAKAMVDSMMKSESESRKIVAMCIIRILMEKVPHQIYNDMQNITEYMEVALRSSEPLLLAVGCRTIASRTFCNLFAWNVIDVEMFLPLTIPYLVHPDTCVRYWAREAAAKLFQIIRVPCESAVRMMFIIADKVYEADKFRFLTLFANSIDAQMMIEEEEVQQIIGFISSLCAKGDDDCLAGVMYIAVKLMRVAPNTTEVLMPIVMDLLGRAMKSEDVSYHAYGMMILSKLLQVDAGAAISVFRECLPIAAHLLELDENMFAGNKQKAAIAIAALNAVCEGNPFSEPLLAIATTWLRTEEPSYVCTALHMFKRGVISRTNEEIVGVFRLIADTCCCTNDMHVACKCVNTMGHIMKKANDDIKPELVSIGYQMTMFYIQGELRVLDGIPPMSTDIDFSLMWAYTKEVCRLMATPNDLQRTIFEFTLAIIERRNSIKTELMFFFWAKALKCKAFLPQEVEIIKQVALSHLVADLPPELMMKTSQLVQSLIHEGHFDWETIHPRLPVLVKWWNRCCECKSRMRSTMSNILILMFTIMGTFDVPLSRIKPVMIETIFQAFPPGYIKRTGKMAEMIIRLFGQPDIPVQSCISAALAITRLLLYPENILTKRRVSPELRDQLVDVLGDLMGRDPTVRQVVHESVSASPQKMAWLSQFKCFQ